ncbi:MAG TPA: PLP-dependent aminotransferase family protein [Thermoleophilaceae bacterium]
MTRASGPPVDEASWLRLDRRAGETLRAALERALRDAIRDGALRAGVRLPSSRRLAEQMGVSRGVASDVYAQLEAQGFVTMRPRSAPVVAPVRAAVRHGAEAGPPPARPPRFDMTPTTPDVSLFPMRRWLAASAHAMRGAPVSALGYGDPLGDPGLRETLAGHLGRTRGVVADPARIVIVQGTAQGIDLLLRVLVARGARRVAVEDPSLNRQHERIRGVGLEPVGAPVDGQGIVVAGMRAEAALVTPAHQFPTGVVLSGERRRELLDWSRAHGGLVIEDDYDAEFRYDREPVRVMQGLDPERVAYLGTVSKSLAPALRIGWLVAPPGLIDDAARTKRLLDFASPVLDQLALRRLMESGDYDRHIRRVRAVYRARRDRLTGALARRLPELEVQGVAAGLHVLARLPDGLDDERVAREAAAAGLLVEPLSESWLGPRGPHGLVLGYGGVHESAVEPAVEELAAAIERAASR